MAKTQIEHIDFRDRDIESQTAYASLQMRCWNAEETIKAANILLGQRDDKINLLLDQIKDLKEENQNLKILSQHDLDQANKIKIINRIVV